MDDLISKLSEIRSDYNCFSADEEPYYRALSEAIKILSQRADGDTISRQAAIDDIRTLKPDGLLVDAKWIEMWLKQLPSAQPEIIRCKDCKYMIDIGDDLMCDNAKGWVVATASDFGCVLAERRTE